MRSIVTHLVHLNASWIFAMRAFSDSVIFPKSTISVLVLCISLIMVLMTFSSCGMQALASESDNDSVKRSVTVKAEGSTAVKRAGGGPGKEIYHRYKLKKKHTAEFVSLRCGIGAHWVEGEKRCVPHAHQSDEDSPEKPESAEHVFEDEPKTMKSAEPAAESREIVIGHIVSLHCGIGYSYDKSTHKCSPLPSTGQGSGGDSGSGSRPDSASSTASPSTTSASAGSSSSSTTGDVGGDHQSSGSSGINSGDSSSTDAPPGAGTEASAGSGHGAENSS